PAVVHDGNPVTEALGLFHVMGGEHDGASGGAQLLHQLPYLPPRLGVEAGGGLVEEDEVGISHQGAAEGQALLLAAGERAYPRAALLLELDQCDHVLDIAAMPVETAEELEGLVHRDLLGELGLVQLDAEALAQVMGMAAPAEAEHFDLSGIGRGEPLTDLDGGGLPRAVRAEEAKAFTGVDGKVEAVHRHYVAVVLVEVPD